MIETQIIDFKLLRMECCGHLLCWINPRFPTYCPECGKGCYPACKGWITLHPTYARLTYEIIR
jgi:hypothetical protein